MAPETPSLSEISDFFPDSRLTKSIRSTGEGYNLEKDVFNFDHPNFVNMMRFIFTGKNLPLSENEYYERFGINGKAIGAVKEPVNTMLPVYKDIHTDNADFYDNQWPKFVSLAGKVKDYADNAGGDESTSFYKALIDAVNSWVKNKDQDSKTAIIEFTDRFVRDIEHLQKESAEVRTTLGTFQSRTSEHAVKLSSKDGAIKQALVKDEKEKQRLEKDISDLQDQLKREHNELSYDLKVAETTPAYAWCTIFGFIAAVVVAGIYAKKIVDVKKEIRETEKKIETDEEELRAIRIVCTDVQRMTKEADGLIDQINPAIKLIGELETSWSKMAQQFGGLNNLAKQKPEDIQSITVEKMEVNKMIHKWNDIQALVDKYQSTAYLLPPEVLDIERWVKKYCPDK